MMRKNPQQAIDYMVNGTLMKRLAQPDEMVGAALLLCSAQAVTSRGRSSSSTAAEPRADSARRTWVTNTRFRATAYR